MLDTLINNILCIDGMEIDFDNYEPYLEIVRNTISTTNEFITQIETYYLEKRRYSVFNKWKKSYDAVKKSYDIAEEKYNQASEEFKLLENIYESAIANKDISVQKLDILIKLQSDYSQYMIELKMRTVEYESANNNLKYIWYNTLYQYRSHIHFHLNYINKQISELQIQDASISLSLTQLSEKDKLISEISLINQILNIYPIWNEWNSLTQIEKKLELDIKGLETLISGSSTGTTDELYTLIKQSASAVQFLYDNITKYRTLLYTEQAININSRVNNILALICDERPLKLYAEWSDKLDTLAWFVIDGTSKHIIEKCSGFQRFIISIATRIGFHNMGVDRVHFDQFFIDEGFTSCDTDNLDKIPDFLRTLLKVYDSICLVSHLDDLKACADIHINIKRVGELSLINHPIATESTEKEEIIISKKSKKTATSKKSLTINKLQK
jgi:hypothetical protein